MPTEPSLQTVLETVNDVLEALNSFATSVDSQFVEIRSEINGIKGEISGIKGEISGIKGEITNIRATMVTKDYLDNKLADLRGDLVLLARKGNRKLEVFVEECVTEGRLSASAAQKILSLEPFPR